MNMCVCVCVCVCVQLCKRECVCVFMQKEHLNDARILDHTVYMLKWRSSFEHEIEFYLKLQ